LVSYYWPDVGGRSLPERCHFSQLIKFTARLHYVVSRGDGRGPMGRATSSRSAPRSVYRRRRNVYLASRLPTDRISVCPYSVAAVDDAWYRQPRLLASHALSRTTIFIHCVIYWCGWLDSSENARPSIQ